MSTTKKFGTSLEKATPIQVVIKPKSKSPTGIWQFVWKSKLEPRMFSHQNHCHHETPLKFKMLKCLFEIKCTRLHKHFESSNFKNHLYSGNGSADENTCKNILNDKSCNSKSMHKLQFFTRQHTVLKSQQPYTMRFAWPGPWSRMTWAEKLKQFSSVSDWNTCSSQPGGECKHFSGSQYVDTIQLLEPKSSRQT